MDLLTADRRALELFDAHLGGVTTDDLTRPTPCADWDVEALIRHVIGGNAMFAACAQNGSAEWDQRDKQELGSDLEATFRSSAELLLASFSPEDAQQRVMQLPFGDYPGSIGLAVHFVDTLVHTWDLASALGRDSTLPPDLTELALNVVSFYPDEMWGDPRYFAHVRAPGAAASATDVLIARVGRDPHWIA